MPTNFGTDLSGVSDLDAAGAEVSGRLLLSQALARRLITPRGRLIDDANYGYDLTQYINDDLVPQDFARIKSGIEAECAKDERVVSTIATVSMTANVLIVSLSINDAAGSFNLVLSVNAVTATILSTGQ